MQPIVPRNRFDHNSYFNFHPMHSSFALVAAMILLGLLAWFLVAIR